MLLTKLPDPDDTNTRWAQGGIIYTGPDDAPELLVKDVLAAGAGASSPEAARILATEGPQQVRELLIEELGVEFDHDGAGLSLAREGAHSAARILHQKDSTGWAIQRALAAAVRAEPRVTPLYGAEALSLTVEDGRCVGLEVLLDGEAVQVRARSVVLATGGLGALYAHTTNPDHATGDGVALAIQAGAAIRDLHYVQFHPTALYAPGGNRFLVSEAVRGEGAVLLDADGQEFIEHPLGSLAPRDVVAREMWETGQRSGAPCAHLHLPSRSEGWFRERFPAIFAKCVEAGINVPDEPIPVTPAAHYSCGGVETDEHGRTSVRGLWAAGEVARTGLHGANRLASTSLLEGLVWGRRAGKDAARPSVQAPTPTTAVPTAVASGAEVGQEVLAARWARLRETMWEYAGLARSGDGLRRGLSELATLKCEIGGAQDVESLRLRRALLVATRLTADALADPVSRGCHYRTDSYNVEPARLPG